MPQKKMTREEFEAARAQVHGINTQRHAPLVEGVIKWAKPARVVEIGAFQGFMSVTIMRALQEAGGGHLHVVDSFYDFGTNPKSLRETLSKFGDNFDVQIATSATMQVPKIDMAVIDANHSYEWAKADTLASIAAGAWILMYHDSQDFQGVRDVVSELRAMPNWGVVELPFNAGYALAIERFDAGPAIVPREETSV